MVDVVTGYQPGAVRALRSAPEVRDAAPHFASFTTSPIAASTDSAIVCHHVADGCSDVESG
jgi:hypothetical protein